MFRTRKTALLYFAVAFFFAIVAFYALFVGHVDHFIAGGAALLAFVGFWVSFSRGWDEWGTNSRAERSIP